MLALSRPLSSEKVAAYFRHQDPVLNLPGTWAGRGAERLGLRDEVQPASLRAVLDGINPLNGDQLREKAKTGHERAAVDMVLSPPKSLSIAAIGDMSIVLAHDKAAYATIDYLEAYAQTRQQTDGARTIIATDNLVVAKFDHFLSRSLDPQLHSHLVVMNLTQLSEGQWRALNNNPLYQHQLAIGQFYRTELAQQLLENGFQINTIDNDRCLFEIKGVPKELISVFSSRREDLSNPVLLGNLRESYPSASEAKIHELATYKTRPDKEMALSKENLLQNWRDVALEKGYDLCQLQLPIGQSKAISVEHDPGSAAPKQQETTISELSSEHRAPGESALADFLCHQESCNLEPTPIAQEQEQAR